MSEGARALARPQIVDAPAEVPPSRRQQVVIALRSTDVKTARLLRPVEVAALVALSAVLHAGAAYAVYTSEKASPQKRLSSVNIEFLRAPEPVVEPPPPPPPPPPEPEPVAKPIARQAVAQAPAPAPPEPEPPQDPGSSAEAADDGNLIAGKGGTGLPPPAPAAPPAPAVVAPLPVVQAHEGANYAKNPRPAYPGRAKREGWQGRVLLRVQVQPNGRSGQMSVQKSSGHQQLDEAALAAVRGWSFVPARQGGDPVSGWVTVPIEFRLQ